MAYFKLYWRNANTEDGTINQILIGAWWDSAEKLYGKGN